VHAAVRRYRTSDIDSLVAKVEDEFVEKVKGVDGFVGYYVIDGGGGMPGWRRSDRFSRQRRGSGPACPASKNERSIDPPGFRAFFERARDGFVWVRHYSPA